MADIKTRIKSYAGVDTSQPSTWRGIVMLVVSAGITAMPQQHMTWFLPLCLAVIGLLGFVTRDTPVAPGYQVPSSTDREEDDDDFDEEPSLDELVRSNQR